MTFQSVHHTDVHDDYKARDFRGFVNRYIEHICYRGAENLVVDDSTYWLRQEFLLRGLDAIAKPFYSRNPKVVERMAACETTIKQCRGNRYVYIEAMYAWLTELVAYFKKLNFLGEIDVYEYPLYGEAIEKKMNLHDLARTFINEHSIDEFVETINEMLLRDAEVDKKCKDFAERKKSITLDQIINPSHVKKMMETIAKAEVIRSGYADKARQGSPAIG